MLVARRKSNVVIAPSLRAVARPAQVGESVQHGGEGSLPAAFSV